MAKAVSKRAKAEATTKKATKEQLLEKALKTIEKNRDILFIDDVVVELPISKPTFYKYFPVDSKEYEEITARLDSNKIRKKRFIRSKLSESGKATELLALYRMIATDEERRVINQNYVELTGKDGKDLIPSIKVEIVDSAEAGG